MAYHLFKEQWLALVVKQGVQLVSIQKEENGK